MYPFAMPLRQWYCERPDSVGGPKASSVWQLFNYAEWLAECKGRVLLRINLDESALCLYPGVGKGAVFLSRKRLREDRGHKQHVPFPKRRCYVSYVAVICDRTDVQPSLPHRLRLYAK